MARKFVNISMEKSSKIFQPHHIGFIAISVLMLLSWALKIVGVIDVIKIWNWDSYDVTEFLINYQAGFVRRGLLGELLYKYSISTGLTPKIPILVICILSYIIVLWFFLRQFHKHKLIWWLVFTTFLCGMFENFIRKDYLMYALIIAEIYLARKGIKTYSQALIITAISIFGLLLHEAYIFFGVPFVALMMLRSNKWKVFLPMLITIVLVFGVLAYFKGDESYVRHIMDSWNTFLKGDYLNPNDANSISALGWSAEFAIKLHWDLNTFMFTHPWIPTWIVIMMRMFFYILTYYYITNFLYVFKFKADFSNIDRWNISALYLFSTMCLLPLFLFFSCDYGRVYQYAWMTTFIIYLLIPRGYIRQLFGTKFINFAKLISEKVNRILIPNKSIMVFMLLFLAESITLYQPEESFGISPVGTVIMWLSKL